MKGYVPITHHRCSAPVRSRPMPVDFGTPPRKPHYPWWVPFFVLLCVAVIIVSYN